MPKISVVGICGNSIFMYADHFHQNGETLVADSVFEEIGGKGINQAVAAKRMGAEVSFLGAIGDDTDGEKCLKAAEENGIKLPKDELDLLAERFALERGGRSARLAKQFIDGILSR